MKNKCYEKILGWGTTVRERYIYIHLQAQHRRSSSKQSKYVSCSVMSDLLQPHGLQPSRFLCPWKSPGKNTGVGCDFLLQGIFLTQGLNPCLLCLLHCRWILYPLSHLYSSIYVNPKLLIYPPPTLTISFLCLWIYIWFAYKLFFSM